MRQHLLAITIIACVLGGCQTHTPTFVLRENADVDYRYGRYEDAAAKYGEIVTRNPGDWQAQHRYGQSTLKLGKADEARRALEQAHALRPGNEEIVDDLAEAMFQQGQENELFAFLRARADDTRSTHAYLNLAKYAVELGDMDTASVATLTAIEVDEGQSVEPYLARAALAERLGNSQEATRRLRQAYGVNPNDARVTDKLKEYGEVPGPTIALPPGK